MWWRRFVEVELRGLADAVGQASRDIARLRASTSDLSSFTADCPQCGSDRVDVLRLTTRDVRLSCRACRAVVSTRNVGLARPVGSRSRAAPEAAGPATPDSLAGLAPYVSPLVLAWLWGSRGAASANVRLDKASVYRVWKEFDRFVATARQKTPEAERYAALAAEAGMATEPPAEALPSFGEIAGQLQSYCYDESAVVATLSSASKAAADDALWSAALVARVACARRWLSSPGIEHCWIRSAAEDAPDPEALRRLLADDGPDRRLDAEARQALFAAAFGTSGGPPTRCLLDTFGAVALRAAVATHLRDGTNPLRAPVLAALERGELVL